MRRRRPRLGFVDFVLIVFAAAQAFGVVLPRRLFAVRGGVRAAGDGGRRRLSSSRLAHQRFAVGVRDLVVVGVDFVEGQEAVAVAAVFTTNAAWSEGSYGGDLGQIDCCRAAVSWRGFRKSNSSNPCIRPGRRPAFFGVGGCRSASLRHKGVLAGALAGHLVRAPAAGARTQIARRLAAAGSARVRFGMSGGGAAPLGQYIFKCAHLRSAGGWVSRRRLQEGAGPTHGQHRFAEVPQ